MPRCAILTLKDLSDFECYDHLLIKPMKRKGWDCIMVPWDDKNVSWDSFDLAIIRSTWDYQNRLEDFIKVLQKIQLETVQTKCDVLKLRYCEKATKFERNIPLF